MARQNHKTMTSPAPIGGLNVQDSLVAMPATDATVLRNFFPQPYGLEVRKGYQRHVTSLGDVVKSLMHHVTARTTAGTKLFAWAGANMFDITTASNVAPTPVLTGLTDSRWNYVGMSNASGMNNVAVNAIDDPIWVHDNHTTTRITAAVNPLDPQAGEIAGVDPRRFITGTVHQKRIWWVEKSSTKAWYLDPEAITGQAYLFDFGSQFKRGGRLLALASWTLDSGVGPDDLLVAISSEGEIAIYSGSDPDSLATFSLRGVFYTGAPLGDRCLVTMAGDLLVLTQYGLMSMNAAMASSDTTEIEGNSYLSGKIQYLISTLAASLVDVEGWELRTWPDSNMILVNVPLGTTTWNANSVNKAAAPLERATGTGQLVQSTITKGWAQWDDMDAATWVTYEHGLYFGDYAGNVWQAWHGNTDGAVLEDDGSITAGQPVSAECQTAFNFMGELSTIKHAKMARPTFIGNGKVEYTVKANSDFNYDAAISPGASPNQLGSAWNVGRWGQVKWVGGVQTQKLWTAVSGLGNAFALRLAFHSYTPVLWASYDFIYEDGTNI